MNTINNLEKKDMFDIEDLIFKEKLPSVDSILEKYPERVSPEGSMVTRFAPSPTGFLHIGGVYMALISERFAHQTGGVYFVRLEDTDQKRKIAEAESIINEGLKYFNLSPDEGKVDSCEIGQYGPYEQSKRVEIYQAFLKKLIKENKVYPCFATEEELDDMRKMQGEMGVTPGYYGVWAKWRDADIPDVIKKLKEGASYVLRFKSEGNPEKRVIIDDLIKGKLELPENNLDVVVMKVDGLPTYHFAHVVDDFLMKPTHIIRADEWVSSVPLHFELSDALGFPRLKYGHILPITKIEENGTKRKLSKRKDPEANVEYYQDKGYPNLAVIEYLMNLANSDFEDWRKDNQDKPYSEFGLTFRKLSQSNSPLFDEVKLRDISKEVISKMSLDEFYENILNWSKKNDLIFYEKISNNKEYWGKVFSIERDSSKRKDIGTWSEVSKFYSYFDIQEFNLPSWGEFTTPLNSSEVELIMKKFHQELEGLKTAEEFMQFMRILAKELGLAESIKEYKASKGELRGHVGLISQVIRFAVTGLNNTPDLFQIIQVLGAEEVKRRLIK